MAATLGYEGRFGPGSRSIGPERIPPLLTHSTLSLLPHHTRHAEDEADRVTGEAIGLENVWSEEVGEQGIGHPGVAEVVEMEVIGGQHIAAARPTPGVDEPMTMTAGRLTEGVVG